jgi:hypothetical protein
MIDVLLLGRQYGYPSLKIAMEKALEMSCFDVDVVRLLLDAKAWEDENPKQWRSGYYVATTGRNRPPGTTTSCCGTILRRG